MQHKTNYRALVRGSSDIYWPKRRTPEAQGEGLTFWNTSNGIPSQTDIGSHQITMEAD